MKLTARARAAVTAMTDLASVQGGGAVSLADIALRQRLSLPFLEQIFAKLRRAGLVTSQRGAGGGYRLAQSAEEITPAIIVRAVEEEIRSTACVPGEPLGCTGTEVRCLTHELWANLDRHIESYLDGVTLAELCDLGPSEAGAREELADG